MIDRRLMAVAEMLPEKTELAADIGTDHGKLGAYLLETGRCAKIWFSDISAPSLEKARQLTEEKGFGDRAACFVGDGALPLPGCPDAAVIAGMGGNTISAIITAGIEKLRNTYLVLQPNTHITETRQCLMECGFRIKDERLTEEGGRIYNVIAAVPGRCELNFEQLLVGPVLMSDESELMKRYALRRLSLAMTALEGRKNARAQDTGLAEAEVEVWKKYV